MAQDLATLEQELGPGGIRQRFLKIFHFIFVEGSDRCCLVMSPLVISTPPGEEPRIPDLLAGATDAVGKDSKNGLRPWG